jgi:hypothetical protein
MEHNNRISDILKRIPLEVRVKVTIESYLIIKHGGQMSLPVDKNGGDTPEAIEILAKNHKILEEHKDLVKWVLDDIKEWKEDGCPEDKNETTNIE